MKISFRTKLFSAVVVLALLSIAAAPLAGYSTFAGTWKGTDVGDGSKLTMYITGGVFVPGVYQVNYSDNFVAACGGLAKASGRGTVVANVLVTNLKLKCKSTGAVVDSHFNLNLVLNGATASLTDAGGSSYALVRPANCNGR